MTSSIERRARAFHLLAQHEKLHAQGKRLPQHEHVEMHQLLAEHGGHIYTGRIPMNDAEYAAVDALLGKHEGPGMLTRRDPGETGPVLVQVGERTFEIAEDGAVTGG